MKKTPAMIWIITGPREVGKTRFCNHLVHQARTSQIEISGLLCPPIYSERNKTGFTIQNLQTEETRVLARLNPAFITDSDSCKWVFDPEALIWGNEILQKSIPCELLVIDELGPMEFEQQKGWTEGLKAVDSRQYKKAVIVIRPELTEQACLRWPEAQTLEIPPDLDRKKEQELTHKILLD